MTVRYVVLGATGSIGRYVVRDLLETTRDAEIVVVTRNRKELVTFFGRYKKRLRFATADVTNVKQTARVLNSATVCINCTNYYFNLSVMRACLQAHCHYLDLGGLYHMTRKQLQLHKAFKKKGLLAVLGCGSTPGITNVLIAATAPRFDRLDAVHIRFGGHDWTSYKQHFVLPYTAYTLFDEFTDQPMIFTGGTLKATKPLTGNDSYTFPSPVGKKMCFYTLHSELATIPDAYRVQGLKNCTFRVCFPEDFVHDVSLLIETGLASKKVIRFGRSSFRPIDFTARELNRQSLPHNAKIKDLELIWVDLMGTRGGKKMQISAYCEAQSHLRWNAGAGSVDTAVPPSVIAQFIAHDIIGDRGVYAPERCIPPRLFFHELEKRGLQIHIRQRSLR